MLSMKRYLSFCSMECNNHVVANRLMLSMKRYLSLCIILGLLVILGRQDFSWSLSLIPPSYKIADLDQVTLYKSKADTQFDFSADGRWVIYDFEGNIWLMNANGSGKQVLTKGSHPTFSPDGRKIAYEEDESIWLYDLERKEEIMLSEGAINPKFSPDEEKIAFLSTRSISNNIWIIDSDGQNLRQIIDLGSKRIIKYYTWSNSGNWIAFSSAEVEPTFGGVRSGSLDIWLINKEGTYQERLVSPGEGAPPVFSPEDDKLAFISNPEGSPGLYLIDLESREENLLFRSDAFSYLKYTDYFEEEFLGEERHWAPRPSFSAEGKKIAFPVFNKDVSAFTISLIDLKGKKITDLAYGKGVIQDLRFSPNGDKITFLRSKTLNARTPYALFTLSFTQVVINGEKINFDLFPLTKEGVLLIPLKVTSLNLGAKVSFEQLTKTIYLSREALCAELKLDSQKALVNGEVVSLKVAPTVIGGEVFVALKDLANILKAGISWDKSSRTAYLNTE